METSNHIVVILFEPSGECRESNQKYAVSTFIPHRWLSTHIFISSCRIIRDLCKSLMYSLCSPHFQNCILNSFTCFSSTSTAISCKSCFDIFLRYSLNISFHLFGVSNGWRRTGFPLQDSAGVYLNYGPGPCHWIRLWASVIHFLRHNIFP
jgi:hypothetical protein